MSEKFLESPKVPDLVNKTEKFDLNKFLQENNIDRNNPEMAKKIANFEKSLQNQKNITQSHLLDLLAFHGISASYKKIERKITFHEEEKKDEAISQNTQNWAIIQGDNMKNSPILRLPRSYDFSQKTEKVTDSEDETSIKSTKVATESFSTKNLEVISEKEKMEANRLGQRLQREFSELENMKMSQRQIEKFFEEKWIEVHLNVGEHIQDVPFISDITGLGLKRKKKEKFIETKEGTLPLSDIIAVKEIHGKIFALNYTDSRRNYTQISLIKEDSKNSFDVFLKNLPTRKKEVVDFWWDYLSAGLVKRIKDVPFDGFKEIISGKERDFKVFDVNSLAQDRWFMFRSWNGFVEMSNYWRHVRTFFVNKNTGYTEGEIQEVNMKRQQRKDVSWNSIVSHVKTSDDSNFIPSEQQIPSLGNVANNASKTTDNGNKIYKKWDAIIKRDGRSLHIAQSGRDGVVIINNSK